MIFPDIDQIKWLIFALIFSFGISPFILMEHFRRKDIARLLKTGIVTNAHILGYEWRGEGKGRHFVIVYQFQPVDSSEPISFSKTIFTSEKNGPSTGSVVAIHYNKTYPMISAIDCLGLNQSIESYPDSLQHRKEPNKLLAASSAFMLVFLVIGLIFLVIGPVTRDDLVEVDGKVNAVERRHDRSDYLRISILQRGNTIRQVDMTGWRGGFGLYEGLNVGDDVRVLAKPHYSGHWDIYGLTDNDVEIRSVDAFLALQKDDYFSGIRLIFSAAFVAMLFSFIGLYVVIRKRKYPSHFKQG